MIQERPQDQAETEITKERWDKENTAKECDLSQDISYGTPHK